MEVSGAAEPGAEVAGKRPHVGPRTASEVDSQVRRGLFGVEAQQHDLVNGDRARRQREGLSRTRRPVCSLAPALAGAEDRWHLIERADESLERIADFGLGWHGSGDGLDRSLGVVGRAPRPQADDGFVALRAAGQLLAEARRCADQDGQHTRRQWIERPGVADAPGATQSPHHADHVVAGRSDRLVEVNDPEHRLGRARARIRPAGGSAPPTAVRRSNSRQPEHAHRHRMSRSPRPHPRARWCAR